MRFIHIDPRSKTVGAIEADQPSAAVPTLSPLNTDHGVVVRTEEGVGVGIIVYEYGLMEGNGPYFSLCGKLYSGDAVLYAFNEVGDTVNMSEQWDWMLSPVWMKDKQQVERCIKAGIVERPETRVNGAVLWRWS